MKAKMIMKRILPVILIAAIFISTVSTSAYASGFADISSGYSYLDSVNYVSDNKIMVGTSADRFSPNSTLTRAMAVQVLYCVAGSPFVFTTTQFTDVPSSAWYAKAVSWATSKGIVSGTTSTTFSPNTNVTRQDAMSFLYRYAQTTTTAVNKTKNISSYSDYSSVTAYARTPMSWAIGNGVLEPISGKLAPKTNATRIMFAHAITKFGTNVERLANKRDRLSFYNEGNQKDTSNTLNYFSEKYFMTDSHKKKWENKVKGAYGSSFDNVSAALTSFLASSGRDVNGRCFGMNLVSVLDKYGKIAFNENFSSSSTMQGVSCSSKSLVESAITYYHASQLIPDYDVREHIENDVGPLLNSLLDANTSGPSLFNYIAFDPKGFDYGHSVVVNSCTYSGGSYTLNVYDPNIAGCTSWKITPRGGFYYLPNGDHFSFGYTTTNIDAMDFLDIDGYQNSKYAATSPTSSFEPFEEQKDIKENVEYDYPDTYEADLSESAMILLPLGKNTTITNESGETLTITDGEFSGDMEIQYWNFITGTSPLVAYFIVPSSNTYTIETTEAQTSVPIRVADKYRYQSIGGFSGKAVLHGDGDISVTGDSDDFRIECRRSGDKYTKSLNGTGFDSLHISFDGDNLIPSGIIGDYTMGKIDEFGVEQTTPFDSTLPAESATTAEE